MSASGQGSISAAPRTVLPVPPAPPAPPFAPTSADNGLSVDTVSGRIVLGNNVGQTSAALLSNRVVPQSGFTFQFLDGVKESTIYPAGIGTHLFTSDNFNGQLLVLNGHNVSAGVNAFMSVALFNNVNKSIQSIVTGSGYAFAGGFQGNEASLYVSGATPNLNFISDAGGNFHFCPGGLNRTSLAVSMYNTTGNVRIGITNADPGVKLQIDGAIRTASGAPLTAAAVSWRFGANVVAAAVLDATQYIEVVINNVLVKLARVV